MIKTICCFLIVASIICASKLNAMTPEIEVLIKGIADPKIQNFTKHVLQLIPTEDLSPSVVDVVKLMYVRDTEKQKKPGLNPRPPS